MTLLELQNWMENMIKKNSMGCITTFFSATSQPKSCE